MRDREEERERYLHGEGGRGEVEERGERKWKKEKRSEELGVRPWKSWFGLT